MAKKKQKILSAVDIADALEAVRLNMADQKKVERDLTAQLLDALHAEQIDRAGNYKLSKAISLKVVEPEVAVQWAAQTNCLKVDTSKAMQILRHSFDDPNKYGFERVETERIVPIKGTKEEE